MINSKILDGGTASPEFCATVAFGMTGGMCWAAFAYVLFGMN